MWGHFYCSLSMVLKELNLYTLASGNNTLVTRSIVWQAASKDWQAINQGNLANYFISSLQGRGDNLTKTNSN